MRLVKTGGRGELSLTKDLIEDIPRYAILSHAWGEDDEEVTFNDLKDGSGNNKAGYTKIQFCGEQAQRDGLQHFWVDTCCIDKANHVELSEAIASMFRWYGNAVKCYVFLSDVSARKRGNEEMERAWESAFRESRWFTRGWTLQELLAPQQVEFYSREGERLGDKNTLEREIHEITQIPIAALRGAPLSDFSVSERMRWTSKRNTRRIEDQAYCLLGIFDVSMSPIYGEREKAFIRLKDEIWRSYRSWLDEIGQNLVTSNSGSLNKHGTGLTSVNTEEIPPHERRMTLLTSLSFDQMDSRQSTIKSAYSTTCEWLLQHPAYVDWMDPDKLHQHRGFLWINGKPGAGKSTLMKFAHAYADRERPEIEILVSFFFNARGDELERSIIGMYRALLFQLLNKAADLQRLLDDLHPSPEHPDQRSAWTIKLLCELLSSAITGLGQRRLKCFVDALDECDEQQVREMVIFFEELCQNALEKGSQLYICFASRHYPTIDIRSGRQLTLEDEHGHGEDLAKYVQSHLRAGNRKDSEEVRTQIREKSNGVFMWTVLVVDILNEEFRRGRIFAVKKRLQEIPAKLGDLFKDILRRDTTNMTDLLLCLQWILFAKRPLRREEFYFAMVAGLDPDPENMTEWDAERIIANDMNRFVLNSSKGLAELTKSKTPTVQFIHESVRDFLVKDNGLCELWPELGKDLYSLSHDQLKRCCQNYLNVDISGCVSSDQTLPKASSDSAKDLRQVLGTKFPFLEYASRHVLYHADEAARGILQDDFLGNFSLSTWVNVTNPFERYEIRRHTPDASLLYVLAENNCARLIRTACKHGSTVGVRGERYQYPLFAALANGHRDAVRALLQQDGNSLMEDVAADLEYGRAFSARKNHTPLLWALDNKHKALAEKLVTYTDIDLTTRDSGGRSPLSLAAENGYEAIVQRLLAADGIDTNSDDRTVLSYAVQQGWKGIVQLLLNKGADIDATNNDGNTALMWAVKSGRETIMQLLLDKGANIETTDNNGDTALMCAVKSGRETIVQLLLDKGANIEATNKYREAALIRAVKDGRETIVQLLLNKGANIEVTDGNDCTALMWAAIEEREEIVQLLLDRGANIAATDRYRRETIVQLLLDKGANIEVINKYDNAALIWAAKVGGEKIVQLLLDKGANIEATDNDGNTALTVAVYRERKIFIQLLLDKGANLEATNKYGNTALISAAYGGRKIIVQLLLDKGANIEATNKYGNTALIYAVHSGRETIVQLLLDKGANIEATNNDGDTALIYAAYRGRETIVQLLLDKAANLEATNKYGKTALISAAYSGQKIIVQLLLDKGANIEATDKDGNRALIYAVHSGRETIVQLLIDNGANIEATDKYGNTALIYAANRGWEKIVQLLLDKGANIEATDNHGNTAVIKAAIGGREIIVQLLLEKSTDAEATNKDGNTAASLIDWYRGSSRA